MMSRSLLLREHSFFETLGNGKPNFHASRNLDRLPSLRVSSHTSRRLALLPTAKIGNLDRLALFHGAGDHFDHSIQKRPRLSLRNSDLVGELCYKLRVRHQDLLLVTPATSTASLSIISPKLRRIYL